MEDDYVIIHARDADPFLSATSKHILSETTDGSASEHDSDEFTVLNLEKMSYAAVATMPSLPATAGGKKLKAKSPKKGSDRVWTPRVRGEEAVEEDDDEDIDWEAEKTARGQERINGLVKNKGRRGYAPKEQMLGH
ncbi:hypothetical protein YB2330_003134 [Saitoella coloradoensis]